MTRDQRVVAIGAASGVAAMAASVALVYGSLPAVAGIETVADRLAFALRYDVLALLPFFVSLIAVGNARFLTKAIDPLRHAEGKSIEIDGRVADNTLQQTFVFVVATLALSTYLDAGTIKIIPSLVSVFIVARAAFWIGYRIDPLYRAPGMAATSYMNVGILLTCLYFLFV